MKETFRKNSSRFAKNSQKGFSLLEMIVAITIFLIVTGAVYGLLQIGRIDRNRSSRRSDMLKNARTAIHLIGRDVLNAGLGFHRNGAIVPDNFISTRLGVPPDADTTRDTLTSLIAGNNLFQNNLNSDTTVRTDLVAFAYRDMSFNCFTAPGVACTDNQSGETVSLTGVSAPTGSPTVARLATQTGQAAASSIYDLYLVESDSSQVAVMATAVPGTSQIDIQPGDPLGLNQPFNGAGVNGSLLKKCTTTITEDCTTYAASVKRFYWVAYKVKDDGTLVRLIFGNNTGRPSDEQIREQPLVYGVQNLQFKYVLQNGTVTDNPSAGVDGIIGTTDDEPDDFNLIRQINITLQVQSTEIDEQTRKPAVITLNATFSVRNMDYDAG
ncbi:MAG TPA: prepilin-type N-terminal cleavage/methylation domain-containing protein [Pyrinomonadaceae bacterium]|jgi:prepilin-type N-terminal cleavage/methylation domain-containing protein